MKNQEIKLALELAFQQLLQRITIGSAGRRMTSASIDDVTGNLSIAYADGTTSDLGRVRGGNGEDGTGIQDVQLYEDPADNHRVFFQITLTNGVVLRTQSSISGYNGTSLQSVELIENQLVFTLDDEVHTQLPPIPVAGLTPISIVDGKIVNGELLLTLSDGKVVNTGLTSALAGRGVEDVRLVKGKVEIKYDNADAYVQVGAADGIKTLELVDGKLMVALESDTAPRELGSVVGITGARVEGNELIFTTTAAAPNNEINVGQVGNLKGDQGVGVASVTLVNNTLEFTLTDGTKLPAIPVSGLTPVSVTGARYDATADEVIFTLSDGSEVPSGIKEDLRGESITQVALQNNGDLEMFFSKNPQTGVKVGSIKSIARTFLENGKLKVEYNTAPGVAVEVGDVLGIQDVTIEKGVLRLTYTNGTTQEVGPVRSIKSTAIDGQGNLTLTYTDDSTEAIGRIIGPKGDRGFSVTGAHVNEAGDLLIQSDDPSTPSMNAGHVVSNMTNFIGSVKSFVATAGQTEYLVAHKGEVLIFKNGQIIADGFNLALNDRVVFDPALAAGDKINIIAFADTGLVITGKGIKSIVEQPTGTFNITLENGDVEVLRTLSVNDLPLGIKSMRVTQTGHLEVTMSDSSVIDAGLTSNANNTKTATVNAQGDLIITLDDDTIVNAGSVISNMTIESATIDANGDLILTMNGGARFNAGATGEHITEASINAQGHMVVVTSLGKTIDAGLVTNPVLSNCYYFETTAGQTEIPFDHANKRVVVVANGVVLPEKALVLTDTSKIGFVTPRQSQDEITVICLYQGSYEVDNLSGAASAPAGSVYGKDPAGNIGFFGLGLVKVGQPHSIVATAGQTVIPNIPHAGSIELYVNGILKPENAYSLETAGQVVMLAGLTAGDIVQITVLTAPSPMGAFQPTSYVRVRNEVYANGGTFRAGQWEIRQLNALHENAVSASLFNNRVLLPAGTYYVRGFATANGVGANVIRLFNATTMSELLVGPAHYAGDGSANAGSPNIHAEIEGYFTLESQCAVLLQHKCTKTVGTIGFGVIGDGSIESAKAQRALGVPGCLTELQFWKVS